MHFNFIDTEMENANGNFNNVLSLLKHSWVHPQFTHIHTHIYKPNKNNHSKLH